MELVNLGERLRAGPNVRFLVDSPDQAQQAERFELEDACGFHRLVARQCQNALNTPLLIAHKRADDGIAVHILAGNVRHDIQPGQKTFHLQKVDHTGRLDIGHAAGALGQSDRDKVEWSRDRVRLLPVCPEKVLDGVETEPGSARQFHQNDEFRSSPEFILQTSWSHERLHCDPQSAAMNTTFPNAERYQKFRLIAIPFRHRTSPGCGRHTMANVVGCVHAPSSSFAAPSHSA